MKKEEITFPRIASIYGADLGVEATDVELKMLARYDLLIGGLHINYFYPISKTSRDKLNRNIKRLRELNPNIIILDFSASAPYWGTKAKVQPPEEAFLHTPNGHRIKGWPGTEMLNLSNPEAVEFLATRVPERIKGINVDGVFIDCMSGIFDSWAVEIESRKRVMIDADGDGKPDSISELNRKWTEGKRQLLEKLRELLGDEIIIHINGQRPADFAKPYVNGNYLEDYIDYIIDHRLDWMDVLQLYLDWCDLPHTPNCTTINASSGFWPEYEAWRRLPYDECCDILEKGYSRLQRMRFGLATALMGDGYYGFDLNTRWRGQHWWYAEFDAPLGRALGAASAAEDGTWRREFEGGIVIVNPLPKRVHIKLDGRYRDYTTGWSGREFMIPAYDGRIYLPVGKR